MKQILSPCCMPSPISGFWDIQQDICYSGLCSLLWRRMSLFFFLSALVFLLCWVKLLLDSIVMILQWNWYMLDQVDLPPARQSRNPSLPLSARVGCEPAKIIIDFREGNQAILSLVTTDLICSNSSTDFSHGKCGESFLSTDCQQQLPTLYKF